MDSRNELLESAVQEVGPPSNMTPVNYHNPYQSIEQCPPWSWYLVMTHSHEIDFELCEAILGRKDVHYCGLIGSKSKAVSFRSRLKKKGFTAMEIGHLTSPVGLDLGAGKRPMEVAVSISAQLMQLYYADLKQKREVFNPLSVVSNNNVD
jgi:xanthine dehydrogenase accessory factor